MAWGDDFDKITSMVQLAEVDEADDSTEEFAEEDEAQGKAPTLDEIKAKAKAATPADIANAVKDIRALLDDPDEAMPDDMRTALEKVYKAGQDRLSEEGVDAEEFHGTHDQSTHAAGGRGGVGGKHSSSGGAKVAAIGNKRDPLNQHASTPKEASYKANKARKSGNRWTVAAIAAAVLVPGPIGLGIAAGSIVNAGLRYSQQARHTDQARRLRAEAKVSAAAEGSAVVTFGQLQSFGDDKMLHMKMMFDILDGAAKALEDGDTSSAMEKVLTAKAMIKKKMIGYMAESRIARPMPTPAMQIEVLEEDFAGLPPALAKKVVENLKKSMDKESDPKKKAAILAKIHKMDPAMKMHKMQVEILEEEFAGLPPALAKKVVEKLEKDLAAEPDEKKKAAIQAKIDKFKV